MRNLQKILALALALIMSFSLVVTANAAFSDEADITDTYNEAVNVLSQLEVFKGYTDGTYQPQKSITRAEVAAIIYRIATGDVTDTQVSIYSDWNRFTDVHAGEWWAGYINYCANAEYIKGYGNGKFGPDDPVTGYEALAMILRAVGYGKMDGEFQGSDWAVQTAARASTLKVTKNVQNSALLNSPATRELVAELLFRSILVPTVEYNQFSGYTENDTTLGYQSFGLEAIEGVVVANEFANLYDTQVLADGKTNLEVDGTVRTLDIGSAVTDVGEARYAYVSGSTVYALEDTGSNTVWEPENGVETDISTSAKFRTASGLTTNDTTEYYVNFGREGHFTSDYRLEISITFEPTKNITPERATALAVEQWFEEEYLDDTTVAKALGVDVTLGTNGQDTRTYHKIIRAEDEITQDQLDVIHGIFACADDADGGDSTNAYLGVQGDVYAGTRSAESGSTTNNRYVDLSDDISYRTFLRDYINSEAYDMSFEDTDNGEWLKIVDNDGDGIADYAFKTEYWLDKAVGSYTKSGNTILEYRLLDVEDREDNDGIIIYEDEIAVGDIVLYTDIDNKVIVRKAETAQATINSVSFRDETATATDGTVYEQSGIYNETRLDELLTTMDENVEYNLYFDAYGYVRAYEPAEGTRYGLLTEMYYSRGQNGQYVTNATLTAEMKAGSDAVDEFDVVNKNGNHFLLEAGLQNSSVTETWDDLHDELSKAAYDEWYQNVYKVNRNTEIVLQPALSHLSLRDGSYSNGESRTVDGIFDNVTTNVARYVKTADGEIRITSAAEYYTNERNQRMYYAEGDVGGAKHLPDDGGNRNYPAYAIDYIELDASNGIAEDQRRFEIAAGDYYANSNYVNAVDDTEFYVVTTNANDRRIGYFTGYENVVKINAEDIIAAYTVARNTEFDSEENDYWVADVIVIEVENYQRTYDSIALGYYNPYQTSGRVQAISTLNSETDPTKIDMIPDNNSWGTQWQDWGFYQVIDSRMDGDDLMADQIRKISWTDNGDDFSEYGIYAGVVRRLDAVNERGR